MKNCIYCRCDVPADVPPEHIIPQSFGVFKPDLTLNCVCKECNHYFGSKLEWPMRNERIVGTRRLPFGFKGVVGGIGTKGRRLRYLAGARQLRYLKDTPIMTGIASIPALEICQRGFSSHQVAFGMRMREPDVSFRVCTPLGELKARVRAWGIPNRDSFG